MYTEVTESYVGDLLTELEEVKQIISDYDEMTSKVTSTVYCGYYLTIICC